MIRRTYAIRHVPFEDLGMWTSILQGSDGLIRYFQAGVDNLSPCIADAPDLLVVLGGPIGVYENDQYPFIEDELEIIRHRLERKQRTLGICLGAQLMAAALGARVYPSGVKEIGWAPIQLTDSGTHSCLRHLLGPVLHWHGDTFDLPSDATLLASTPAVKNQAFAIGNHALALQFHIEMDPHCIEPWLIGHTCELSAAKIKPSELRRAAREVPNTFRSNSEGVLTEWLAEVN